MYEIITDIKKTNFYQVFCSDDMDYRNKLFVNENWQFIFFTLEDYFFSDRDKHITSMKGFCNFFKNEKTSLYITPGEPVEEVVEGYGYNTIKFNNQLDFFELPYEVPAPQGQNLATNWTGEFLWSEEGTWGIFHDSYNFTFIMGYDTKITQSIKKHLFEHPNKISSKKMYEIMDNFYPKYEKDETLREIQKNEYFDTIMKNNSWFRS